MGNQRPVGRNAGVRGLRRRVSVNSAFAMFGGDADEMVGHRVHGTSPSKDLADLLA